MYDEEECDDLNMGTDISARRTKSVRPSDIEFDCLLICFCDLGKCYILFDRKYS